jgi:hypothetical protein
MASFSSALKYLYKAIQVIEESKLDHSIAQAVDIDATELGN